jgi:hypothetical protein
MTDHTTLFHSRHRLLHGPEAMNRQPRPPGHLPLPVASPTLPGNASGNPRSRPTPRPRSERRVKRLDPHPSRPPAGRLLPGLLAGALLAAASATSPPAAQAQRPACLPCAGIRVADPATLPALAEALKTAGLTTSATPGTAPGVSTPGDTTPPEPTPTMFVAWTIDLADGATAGAAGTLAAAGATPWVTLRFTTPAPLMSHLDALQRELDIAAAVAAGLPAGSHVQVHWEPARAAAGAADSAPGAAAFAAVAEARAADPTAAAGDPAASSGDPAAAQPATWASDYAFLLKRAAVAVGGAQSAAVITTTPLAADVAMLRDLYAGEIAAYVDVLAFAPAPVDRFAPLLEALVDLDPGRPLVVDGQPFPADPNRALLEAARHAAAGVHLTLFAAPSFDAATVAPLVTLARETAGDLSFDPYSPPSGAGEAYAFVRGRDLGLRVIVEIPEMARDQARLVFADSQLRRPTRIALANAERIPIAGARATAEGLVLRVTEPGSVALFELERATAAELEGIEEEVTIAGERQIPVEEILRRLQAFEDAQERKLHTYQAKRDTSLRFVAGGSQSIDVTFSGAVFYEKEKGFDWAWESLFFNGVRWRGKEIPEIPLVQPEKAAVMPTEITFGRTYRYRLRGRETVDGRDCWVIDFAPADGDAAAVQKLWQGTVWVDTEVYARVRTRALQLGLEGEVLSNEETLFYRPIDASGQPAAWGAEAFVLPLRTTGQQILSVLNTATVVEREVRLDAVRINASDFAAARDAVAASEVTMVRDTDQGLRYLVKDDSGQRVVKEGFDTSKVFGLAGTFWDDANDFPIPLLGINYFDLDFRGTGSQANLFFGGAIAIGSLATPSLFGSRFDAGLDVFALAIKTADQQYRDGEEIEAEEIETRPARVTFNLGHPLGKFAKLDLDLGLEYRSFHRADDTDPSFVLPDATLTQSASLGVTFARQGYQLSASGSWAKRGDWDFWGLPGNQEFDPAQEDYLKWELVAAKNWYLPNFQKIGVELDYLGGEDLDRFSKYEFGFFGSTRVKGVSGSAVRAEEAWLAHVEYGFEVGQLFRLNASLDGALVTDEASGFDQEPLVGIGLGGTVMGPWETIVNFDVGTPLEGPDDGVVLYVVFLKLFDW